MSTDSSRCPSPELPVARASVRDREERRLRLATFGAGPRDNERAALRAMYETYDTADRAQGLPPIEATALSRWLDRVLDGLSVLAWHDDRVVGHAGLSRVGVDRYELVIFVDGDYQGAGVGSSILSHLLDAHRERGGGTVALSVDPGNEAAIGLYRKFDFEVRSETALEIEMEREI